MNSKRILLDGIAHQISLLPRNRRFRTPKRDGQLVLHCPSTLPKIDVQRNTFSAPLRSIVNFPVLLLCILFTNLHKRNTSFASLTSEWQPATPVLLDNVFFYLIFPRIH